MCSRSSCSRRKIPFVKYGGLKFMEATHVKEHMLAVLRWADNPRNALAALRVLQLLARHWVRRHAQNDASY